MPTLYIHIGSGKCGSTSIQHVLSSQKALLEKRGYRTCIIHSEFPEIRHFALRRFRTRDVAAKLETIVYERWRQVIDTPADYGSFVEGLRGCLYTPACHNVVASTEWFSSLHRKENEDRLSILRDVLTPIPPGWGVVIIFYYRQQDQLIESMYRQWFKPSYNCRFDDFLEYVEPFSVDPVHAVYSMNWPRYYHQLSKAIPGAEIHFRSLERAAQAGGLLQDFLGCINLASGVISRSGKNNFQNVGLDSIGTYVLMNADALSEKSKRSLYRFFKTFPLSDSISPCKHFTLLTDAQREALRKYYDPLNQSIQEIEYGEGCTAQWSDNATTITSALAFSALGAQLLHQGNLTTSLTFHQCLRIILRKIRQRFFRVIGFHVF